MTETTAGALHGHQKTETLTTIDLPVDKAATAIADTTTEATPEVQTMTVEDTPKVLDQDTGHPLLTEEEDHRLTEAEPHLTTEANDLLMTETGGLLTTEEMETTGVAVELLPGTDSAVVIAAARAAKRSHPDAPHHTEIHQNQSHLLADLAHPPTEKVASPDLDPEENPNQSPHPGLANPA